MYAKALLPTTPGFPAVPLLIAGVDQLPPIVAYLKANGWQDAASSSMSPGNGELRITTAQRLQLVIGGQIMLDDTNPASPPGWWNAVEAANNNCVVMVSETGSIDLRESAGADVQRLMDQPGALYWGMVPVAVDPH